MAFVRQAPTWLRLPCSSLVAFLGCGSRKFAGGFHAANEPSVAKTAPLLKVFNFWWFNSENP